MNYYSVIIIYNLYSRSLPNQKTFLTMLNTVFWPSLECNLYCKWFHAHISIQVEVVNCINYTMVDGFSTITKWSPEGRALMSMDYQQIIHRVEIITHSKVSPKQRHFAEDYIRAYYLSEQELEKVRERFYSFYVFKLIQAVTRIV